MKESRFALSAVFICALAFLAARCYRESADETLNRAPVTKSMRAFGKGNQSYNVACYYFDPLGASFGQNTLLSRLPWVWGRNKKLESIELKGHFEDGFLTVENTTLAETKENCESEIKRLFPNRPIQLYRITAKKMSEYFYDYPAIFPDEEKNATFPRLVVFGDSLSDTGNLKAWVGAFPAPPYFLGHFTNGPNWTDYLAEEANLTVQNWAYGGAQSQPHNDVDKSQIWNYVKTGGRNFVTGSMSRYIKRFVNDYLLDGQIVAPEKTLFVIWIGGNDYLSKSDSSGAINILIDKPTHKGGGSSVAERTAKSIIDSIDFLRRIGARHFLVINLPNLGISPMVGSDVNYRKGEPLSQEEKRYMLSTRLTEIVNYHNDFLKANIAEQMINRPDAQIIYLDINSAMNRIISGKHPETDEPFDYGFDTVSLSATLKSNSPGKPDIVIGKACYTGSYLGSSNPASMCPMADKALFFDEVHPTTRGHCWISYFIHRVLFDARIIVKEPELGEYQQKCKAH